MTPPLLGLLAALPVAAALLLWLLPAPRARAVALAAAALELAVAVVVAARFDPAVPGFQMVERARWIPGLNAHWHVGVDGLSVLFLPVTALLFVALVLASWTAVRTLPRLFFALLLALEGLTMGIFIALDTLLFFLFWELTLVPLFFLISLWGIGPQRRHAAAKYALVMLAGGVPLLLGFLVAAVTQSGGALPHGLVFDLPALLARPLPAAVQTTVFLLLLAGFAVKVPVVPLHSWLPVVAMEGPAAVAAVMTGLKLGAYGLIRFAVPLAPQAAQELHWLLAGLGVAAILYGALAALVQTNLRRMLAYSSISHVGLVLLGIAAFSLQGVQGAVYQLLNFTVVAGGLFLVAGFIHHRTGSTDLAQLGGAAHTMPKAAAAFLLLGLAGLGLPLTAGFPAEQLLLLSALTTHTGAGLAALAGVILGAAYFLGLWRRAFLGPPGGPAVATALDLRPREQAVVGGLVAVMVAAGLYPALVLDTTRGAAEAWLELLGRGPG